MESNNTTKASILLSKKRWIIPILAQLAARNGGRFVELHNQLGIARESLSRTLCECIELGWVKRNSGHGHPLRPEYLLTHKGQEIALKAENILCAERKANINHDRMGRWGLPVIHIINQGNSRFNELSKKVSIATPRALSLTLKKLSEDQILDRRLIEGYPPVTAYELLPKGKIIAQAIAA